MSDDASEVARLHTAITMLETQQREFGLDHSAQIAELRQRMEKARSTSQRGSSAASTKGQAGRGRRHRVRISQKGSGATATTAGVAAGAGGVPLAAMLRTA
jgi:hypothetical protein